MIDAPSSTWFTASPHWHWLIVAHFSMSGLAGGTYFLATLIDLTRRHEDDRQLARLGYFITLPLLTLVGGVLIVDLSRPDRFWHMLVANHTLLPMFKWWVPMSIGSWAVLLLGGCAFLSCLAAFAERRKPHWRFVRRLRPPGLLGTMVAVPGAMLGLVVTGYTGIMISVLNRPIWSDTPLFGPLFLVSAVTMSAALLLLGAQFLQRTSPVVALLRRLVLWLLLFQIGIWVGLFLSLGPANSGWLGIWGVVLAIGITIGVALPLAIGLLRNGAPNSGGAVAAAALVLAVGAVIRMAIVFVQDGIVR